MAFLEELADYIEAQMSNVTLGTNFFCGRIPQERADGTPPPDTMTLISERVPAPLAVDGSEVYTQEVQVFSRGPTYFAGQDESRAFTDFLLLRKGGIDLTNWSVQAILGGNAGHIGEDAEGRSEWSANIVFQIKKKG